MITTLSPEFKELQKIVKTPYNQDKIVRLLTARFLVSNMGGKTANAAFEEWAFHCSSLCLDPFEGLVYLYQTEGRIKGEEEEPLKMYTEHRELTDKMIKVFIGQERVPLFSAQQRHIEKKASNICKANLERIYSLQS